MSYSLIRCLLAVLALSNAYDTVLSKNVAHLLDIKRPTVHHALEVLQEKGLIRKELYGDVRLTEEGRALAIWDALMHPRFASFSVSTFVSGS